ncbi:thiaminase II [Virgibacillus sp. W0181]|uniref:thiaminase II n=1 Tax=Virgibacillus sp. W0181 TaxID=3391581 RepID=UPI003F484C5A
MTFTKQLREENNDVFEAIFKHPFVQGIGKGDVPKEALIHYVKADYEYLTAFMHLYGVAISKASSREEIAFFNKQIDFVLNSEAHPHNNFCDVIGIGYDELQRYPLPPTADHYVKHMMYHAYNGSLGELVAALLPCPWTYFAIGKELIRTYNPQEDHPFYEWISFYADPGIVELEMRKQLDGIAEKANTDEIARIKDAFRKSCLLELSFWEMAYTCEVWPLENKVGV